MDAGSRERTILDAYRRRHHSPDCGERVRALSIILEMAYEDAADEPARLAREFLQLEGWEVSTFPGEPQCIRESVTKPIGAALPSPEVASLLGALLSARHVERRLGVKPISRLTSSGKLRRDPAWEEMFFTVGALREFLLRYRPTDHSAGGKTWQRRKHSPAVGRCAEIDRILVRFVQEGEVPATPRRPPPRQEEGSPAPSAEPPRPGGVLLTQEQVAERLRKSVKTVQRLRLAGLLPYIPGRPILIREKDFREYCRMASVRRMASPDMSMAPEPSPPKSTQALQAYRRARATMLRQRHSPK